MAAFIHFFVTPISLFSDSLFCWIIFFFNLIPKWCFSRMFNGYFNRCFSIQATVGTEVIIVELPFSKFIFKVWVVQVNSSVKLLKVSLLTSLYFSIQMRRSRLNRPKFAGSPVRCSIPSIFPGTQLQRIPGPGQFGCAERDSEILQSACPESQSN